MLTVAPTERFGVADKKGTVEHGKRADPIVADRDPHRDVTAFAHVRFATRNGRLLYARP
jgi:imidazolonepropionase-like amidohydrolase